MSKVGMPGGSSSIVPPVLSPRREGNQIASDPQLSPTERIEATLRTLKPDKSIFVDTTGMIHTDKRPFVVGEAEPLVSFTALHDGTFSVFSGIPPLNKTYVTHDSAGNREIVEELRFNKVYLGGARLYLGEFCVVLPTSTHSPTDSLNPIEAALVEATPGMILKLGRRDFPIQDDTVSRVHATVLVLRNQVNADGSRTFVAQITPGITAERKVCVQHAADEPEVIEGERRCPGGSSVLLGPLGSVTIPHPVYSAENLSQSLSVMLSEGANIEQAQGFLDTYMPSMYGERVAFSVGAQDRDRWEADGPEKVKVLLLQGRIKDGLKLISEGKCSEAIDVLSNSAALELAGYTFRGDTQFELAELTLEAVRDNLYKVASNSWFWHHSKTVSPSLGVLSDGVTPQNEEERDLLRRWEKEIALLYAEEWTHALQHLLGRGVSRKAALIDQFDSGGGEADVAAFFFENGVRLSHDLVESRYPEREKALAVIRGYQTKEDQDSLERELLQTRPEQTLFLGRNIEKARPGARGISIKQADDSVDGGLERNHARKQLRAIECTITPKSGGGFEIAPYMSVSGHPPTVFVPDERGYYSRLEGAIFLPPGTPFYVGRGFKFVLPS